VSVLAVCASTSPRVTASVKTADMVVYDAVGVRFARTGPTKPGVKEM
jgi:hypothetical protein